MMNWVRTKNSGNSEPVQWYTGPGQEIVEGLQDSSGKTPGSGVFQDDVHLKPSIADNQTESKRKEINRLRQAPENRATHQQTIWIHFRFGIPQQVVDFFKPSLKTVPSRHVAAAAVTIPSYQHQQRKAISTNFLRRWVRGRGAGEPEPQGHQVRPVPPPPPHWGDLRAPDPGPGATATHSRSDAKSRIPPGSSSRRPAAPSLRRRAAA